MTSYFCLFCYFLDDEKCCRNCVDPGTKRAKTAKIVSVGQKWARSEKEYLHSVLTSDTRIWMTGGKRGDLSGHTRIFNFFIFLTKIKNVKKWLSQCHYLPRVDTKTKTTWFYIPICRDTQKNNTNKVDYMYADTKNCGKKMSFTIITPLY